LYIKTIWRPYECNTCLNDESTRFNKSVSIIMNFNLMDIYINKSMVPTQTHSKKKINDSFKTIYFKFFWKIPYIEKIYILENFLDGKIAWIEKKNSKKNILKKIMHWIFFN
jgi:hypothetical protein